MRLSTFGHDILLLFAGPLVWALHFLVIYGLTGIACARPGAEGGFPTAAWHSVAIVTAGIFASALVAASMWLQPRSPSQHSREFVRWISRALGGLAIVAIAWETLPAFLVPGCATGG